jgi:enterochelin esterase-like enzyme
MTRRLLPALLAVLVLWGLFGAWSYLHDYYRYRGFPPPAEPAGVTPGRMVSVHFWSPALNARRHYDVYLPPGYAAQAARGQRFPVLYLLHGSPGNARLFLDVAHLGVDIDTLIAQHRIRPFLVVMPDGSDGTYKSNTQWADTPHGRYESFVLDVVHAVDKRWPTLANRRFRATAGNSSGAYAAVNLALRHLDTFGFAESWSGYFHQTATGPFQGTSAAVVQANSPISYVGGLSARLHRLPFAAFLYGGRREHSTPELLAFSARLRAAGATVQTTTPPGHHDWRLWRTMTPSTLVWLSDRFGGPR